MCQRPDISIDDLLNMKMLELFYVTAGQYIRRVPNGWVYITENAITFIPEQLKPIK